MNFEEIYLDIDTQGDLMLPDGGLYVQGAAAILPRIRGLIQHAHDEQALVISTMQTYPADAQEFDHLPKHCVEGSTGWGKVPVTLVKPYYDVVAEGDEQPDWPTIAKEHAQIIVRKRELPPFETTLLGEIFEALAPERVTIFGVTSDFGVIPSAEYLIAKGHRVRVVFDAMRGVSDDNAAKDQTRLQQDGAELVTTADIIGSNVRRRPTSRSLASRRKAVSP
ncbi:MAG: isochorismatase family protein [Planctomycetota bacterium]